MVYSPCRSVGKTNWYAYLAQLEHTARLDQQGQGRQCIKVIEQYLKIKATRSPKNYICLSRTHYVEIIELDVSVLSRIKPYKIKGL